MAVRNTSSTSAADTAQTITIAAVAGQRIRLFSLDGSTSAGTSTVAVKDGATVIWQSPTGWLTTTGVSRTWGTVPLEASPGNAMVVTTTSAGGGNTATVNAQADQV